MSAAGSKRCQTSETKRVKCDSYPHLNRLSLFSPLVLTSALELTGNEGVWEDEQSPIGTASPLEKQLFQH